MATVAVLLTLSTALDAAQREILLRQTFWACALIESGGDPRAVNLREGAVGIVQIRSIMLKDANRIMGYERWKPADRFDVRKSYEIFRVVCRYYHPKGTPEQWARTWNGGATGARKAATLTYWRKVQRVLRGAAAE